MNADPVDQIKNEIALLQAELNRSHGLRRQIEDKMNEAACLTSNHLFIAVVNGREAKACGVSKEYPTRLFRLIFSTTGDGVIRCKKNFERGSAEFSLVVGGSISFTIKDDDLEDGELHFVIRAFASMNEACLWSNDQTATHINR